MRKNKTSFFERLTGSTRAKESERYVEEQEDFEEKYVSEPEEAELAVDMYQTPTEIVIKTMIAGVRPEDLQVSITREMITIKGSRGGHSEISEGDFFAQELYWGSFTRTIMLPQEVDADNAEAVEKHGLLTVRLPKIIKEKSKTLKVRSI